jgi:hypothetical protein
METSAEFESRKFRPYLPEDAQVNPGRYGAELAFWLSKGLAQRGVVTSYPYHEDWGWFIEYVSEDGNEYRLCCANIDGANDKWQCYLEPKAKGFFGRNKPAADHAGALMNALRGLLADEPDIEHIVWR